MFESAHVPPSSVSRKDSSESSARSSERRLASGCSGGSAISIGSSVTATSSTPSGTSISSSGDSIISARSSLPRASARSAGAGSITRTSSIRERYQSQGERSLEFIVLRQDHEPMTTARSTAIVLRRAVSADADALQRLAQLDSQRLGAGPHLVAERDGELIAAIPQAGG